MKGKKRLIALLLSFLMVLSQMSVATFALDTVADENSDQTVEEQAVEETQPEADVKTAAAETEPAAEEDVAEPETKDAEPAKAEEAKAEPAKAEPAKAEEKKAEPDKAEAKEETFDQSQTVDGVTVNVSAAKGVFPAGSKLSVSKVAVPGAVDTSDAEAAYAFDISILANGEKIQPDGKATVSFTTAEVADYDTAVYHMHDGVQEMSVSESGETASVKTDGFSVYVITFTDAISNGSSATGSVVVIADDYETTLYKMLQSTSPRVLPTNDKGQAKKVASAEVTAGADVIEVTKNESNNTVSTVKVKASKEGTATLKVEMSGYSSTSASDAYTHIFSITVTKEFEVTFDLDGGKIGDKETIDSQYIEAGGNATDPGDPIKDGTCHFDAWYYEDGSETKAFDFETAIERDYDLKAAYMPHLWSWAYADGGNVEGKFYCSYDDCPYHNGFVVKLNAEDVYHVNDVKVTVDDPSNDKGFPKDECAVGSKEYYKGEITDEEGFEAADMVTEEYVNSHEGFYTVRVKASHLHEVNSLFKSFQVVSAGPIAAEGLVYKDGKVVVTDDGLLPEDTTAIVLYKHPTTGKYVSREKLLNDGSIPIGETVIDYIVLPNDDYDPDNPEKSQIGYGEVTIDIAGRMFTISYDLNGGKLNGQTGVVTTKVEEGTVITLPSPTRSGYKFNYWEGSKYNAGDKYTVTADHTFKAVWKANKKGVDTGDTNDIAGLMALMIASLGALGAMGYKRRKEDQR